MVDGAEAAAYGFYEQKYYEVATHLSATRHVYTPSFLLASNTLYNSLTDEQKKVFAEVGRAITDAAYAKSSELETRYLTEMKTKLEVNDVDLPAFQKATESAYADYISSQGEDYLKFVRDTAK